MLDHFPNLVDAGPFKFFPVTLSNHCFLRKYPTAIPPNNHDKVFPSMQIG